MAVEPGVREEVVPQQVWIFLRSLDCDLDRQVLLRGHRSILKFARASSNPDRDANVKDDNAIIDSPIVSREHCELYADLSLDWAVYLRDLGSTHGTFLNERKVPDGVACRVYTGDRLKLGIPVFSGPRSYYPKSFEIRLHWEDTKDHSHSGIPTPAESPSERGKGKAKVKTFSVPIDSDSEASPDLICLGDRRQHAQMASSEHPSSLDKSAEEDASSAKPTCDASSHAKSGKSEENASSSAQNPSKAYIPPEVELVEPIVPSSGNDATKSPPLMQSMALCQNTGVVLHPDENLSGRDSQHASNKDGVCGEVQPSRVMERPGNTPPIREGSPSYSPASPSHLPVSPKYSPAFDNDVSLTSCHHDCQPSAGLGNDMDFNIDSENEDLCSELVSELYIPSEEELLPDSEVEDTDSDPHQLYGDDGEEAEPQHHEYPSSLSDSESIISVPSSTKSYLSGPNYPGQEDGGNNHEMAHESISSAQSSDDDSDEVEPQPSVKDEQRPQDLHHANVDQRSAKIEGKHNLSIGQNDSIGDSVEAFANSQQWEPDLADGNAALLSPGKQMDQGRDISTSLLSSSTIVRPAPGDELQSNLEKRTCNGGQEDLRDTLDYSKGLSTIFSSSTSRESGMGESSLRDTPLPRYTDGPFAGPFRPTPVPNARFDKPPRNSIMDKQEGQELSDIQNSYQNGLDWLSAAQNSAGALTYDPQPTHKRVSIRDLVNSSRASSLDSDEDAVREDSPSKVAQQEYIKDLHTLARGSSVAFDFDSEMKSLPCAQPHSYLAVPDTLSQLASELYTLGSYTLKHSGVYPESKDMGYDRSSAQASDRGECDSQNGEAEFNEDTDAAVEAESSESESLVLKTGRERRATGSVGDSLWDGDAEFETAWVLREKDVLRNQVDDAHRDGPARKKRCLSTSSLAVIQSYGAGPDEPDSSKGKKVDWPPTFSPIEKTTSTSELLQRGKQGYEEANKEPVMNFEAAHEHELAKISVLKDSMLITASSRSCCEAREKETKLPTDAQTKVILEPAKPTTAAVVAATRRNNVASARRRPSWRSFLTGALAGAATVVGAAAAILASVPEEVRQEALREL